jgi:hypothetical protein
MSTKKLQIVGSMIPQSDWNQTDKTKADYIKNKPEQVDTIDKDSTTKQIPSAKAVYDFVDEIIGGIENGSY